jgi:uncharacterized protein with ATP-grasp and redox domains
LIVAVFPLLANPERYRACDTDLLEDRAARNYWLELFRTHFDVQLEAAASIGVLIDNRRAARIAFDRELELVQLQPDRHGRLDILVLDQLRHEALVRNGIIDEFRLIKERENTLALALLGEWLAQIDRIPQEHRLEFIVRGMLAGNLFDMGVKETSSHFSSGAATFEQSIARVPRRPWLIDHLERAHGDWIANQPRKAVIFADNAGADAVLGVLPLAQEMLRSGTQVILAANEAPSLNDVTIDELRDLVAHAAEYDPVFCSQQLQLISSGNAAPLIDLANISDELAAASTDADLIVLVGMGRAIESNFRARFTVRCWRIAMIKDPQVARTVGGKVYDAVFRFDMAG